ncbi:hypothetical protein JZM32_03545 [Acinetobacter pittii]|uniref:hypothetical protein n=1 Tax=Acinetobacter TaxID=469 RepID=UPI00197D3F85|nr:MULTISPECIES: hypothetical protein [Acinetobacter]MBN6527066.1 hypothetical protein [Acinetobacter pittii]MBN6535574.1 hypothetical protein [Acinetobacter pittii]MDS7956816.1 hypothetical protein [Acinetobacter sp. V104_13]MDS7984295.1 hypothetical protein [Acinetobacter sp. V104_3]
MQLKFFKKYFLYDFLIHAFLKPEMAILAGQLKRDFILSTAFSMNIKRDKHV